MSVLSRGPDPAGDGQTYIVSLNEAQLRSTLDPLVDQLAREPVNARFIFNDETRQLEPISESMRGRQLNVGATIQLINQMAPTANHHIPLVFEIEEPGAPSTATAEELGVTELVSSATTYYYGSARAPRQHRDGCQPLPRGYGCARRPVLV
jgi:vancomycin resistance protein YoaR